MHKNTKKSDKPLLKQILDLIPNHILLDLTRKCQSNKGCSTYKTYVMTVCLNLFDWAKY